MTDDRELAAMLHAYNQLSALDRRAQHRVLAWLTDRLLADESYQLEAAEQERRAAKGEVMTASRARSATKETAPMISNELPRAAADVLAERRRQVEAEGWETKHDDAQKHGQLARAAACYAYAGSRVDGGQPGGMAGSYDLYAADVWPWSAAWWKPTTPRRDLVKAGALILAEIERLDRKAAAPVGESDPSDDEAV